ncbi:MAG: hypothetical protein Q8Q73_13365 [Stagnimonas sp.]|nr:hypothetical protein [Stagnimonas sp.]
MTGAELIAGLAAGSLPPAHFNHAAHVQVAWELLRQLPPAQAEARFCELILAYVRALGAEPKFHRTLSLALLRLIAARMRPDEDWPRFQQRCPELFGDARNLLARHYSPQALAAGRDQDLPPDLLPLS